MLGTAAFAYLRFFYRPGLNRRGQQWRDQNLRDAQGRLNRVVAGPGDLMLLLLRGVGRRF